MLFRFLLACFAASAAIAQPPASSPPTLAQPQIAPNERFYKSFQITPIGGGEKVLIILDGGEKQFNVVGAEPVPPKDGGPVTQWTLYSNGSVTLYSKKRILIPNPNSTEGTPVDGMVVTNLSAPPPGSSPAFAGHQSSSKFTTLRRKDKDFKLPIRFDRAGPGLGRMRIWLLWDGNKEIQVEFMDTSFKNTPWTFPGLGNHIKYLSNVYTEGSPAPRFFYLKRNKDDSMTIYGDDDIDKLKAIEKEK